jgi:hypothetical protein
VTPTPHAHQALYGYDEGHRLLASSAELSNADRRLLLRQTDSPDAGITGWNELLAGYPLPSGSFAWCLTWAAPEMLRPGCVWTHVLILEPDALAQVGLFSPSEVFRRPQGPIPDLTPYRDPVALAHWDGGSAVRGGELVKLIAALIWAFYEPPTRPVRVGRVMMKEEQRHLLLMTLWGEVWPELRRTISVADAPQTPRELPDGPFDLQLQRGVRRAAASEARVIDRLPAAKPPRWAEALADEAFAPAGLTAFLSAYGPEFPARRDSVVPVVRIWLAHQASDADQVLATLLAALPEASDGRQLKRDLLAPKRTPSGCSGRLAEPSLLGTLIANEDPAGLLQEDLRIADRVRTLLSKSPAELSPLLDAMPKKDSPAATEAMDAVVASLSPPFVKRLLRSDPEGLQRLVRLRPALAATPEILSALDADQLWDAIRHLRGSQQRTGTVVAVVLAGGEIDAQQVAQSWRGSGPAVAKRLIEAGAPARLRDPWIASMDPAQRLRMASEPGQDPGLIAALADGMPAEKLREWNPELILVALGGSGKLTLSSNALLAALEETERPAWAPVAMAAYERLHPKASADTLGAARSLLVNVGKELPASDVAGRLARSLNQALKRGKWPVCSALLCKDRPAFEALIGADDRAGLARRILADILSDPSAAADWQRAVMTERVSQRADPGWLAKYLDRGLSEIASFLQRR